jgi:hypothetical protein
MMNQINELPAGGLLLIRFSSDREAVLRVLKKRNRGDVRVETIATALSDCLRGVAFTGVCVDYFSNVSATEMKELREKVRTTDPSQGMLVYYDANFYRPTKFTEI